MTTKREPNPFDTCPKHHGFFKSCGCNWQKGKKKDDEEIEPVNDEEKP